MTSKLPMHLTEQVVFDIFYSTCVALLQLHTMETPIIHRDIKVRIKIRKSNNYTITLHRLKHYRFRISIQIDLNQFGILIGSS